VVTRIDPDGTVRRGTVDTAQQSDRQPWEDLAAAAVGVPVPYRPAPGIAIYHISVDEDVVIAAEHDLAGPLRDLVTAVMALGGEMLQRVSRGITGLARILSDGASRRGIELIAYRHPCRSGGYCRLPADAAASRSANRELAGLSLRQVPAHSRLG
jgi:hypothetical protein